MLKHLVLLCHHFSNSFIMIISLDVADNGAVVAEQPVEADARSVHISLGGLLHQMSAGEKVAVGGGLLILKAEPLVLAQPQSLANQKND